MEKIKHTDTNGIFHIELQEIYNYITKIASLYNDVARKYGSLYIIIMTLSLISHYTKIYPWHMSSSNINEKYEILVCKRLWRVCLLSNLLIEKPPLSYMFMGDSNRIMYVALHPLSFTICSYVAFNATHYVTK